MENKITYEQLKELFTENNKRGDPPITGYVVFSQDSFDKPYSEESRTYKVSSDNKAFRPDKIGYSIFASCLDGTDQCLRLDGYIKGDGAWKIEKCYIKINALYCVSNSIGVAVYDVRHPEEKVLAGINDEMPQWYEFAEEENEDGEIEVGFTIGKIFVPFSRCIRI